MSALFCNIYLKQQECYKWVLAKFKFILNPRRLIHFSFLCLLSNQMYQLSE